MEILINELSLCGQYTTVDEFAEQALPELISTLKSFNHNRDLLLKKDDFYSSKITKEITIYEIMVGAISRKYDEIKKFKSLLTTLFEEPYWERDIRQSVDSEYLFNNKDIWGSSLAESYERDRIVLSFKHNDFRSRILPVYKDTLVKDIDNLYDKNHYLEVCWERRIISFKDYCVEKFKGNKLDFSTISSRDGFNLISSVANEQIFLDGFRKFSELTWQQISVDEGLDYKAFNNRRYFREISHTIHKFRINERYRCFGYTHGGVFHVLMFDLEHRLSDHG
jgi:hypothetical protein